MWLIDKSIEFCYGHRVWTQTLNGEYAADLKCACRHLHGHEGKAQVFLQGDQLDHTGMVTDFRHLEWLKKWINEYVDHQFIIDRKDPLFAHLLGEPALVPVYVPGTYHLAGWIIDPESFMTEKPALIEMFEGILVVDFVPTSENLSAWLAQLVDAKMSKIGVKTVRVDWWETPKSRSSWRAA